MATTSTQAAPDLPAFKQRQKAMWASFESVASWTMPAALRLVRFAGIRPGDRVLDVGCGTGNVAATAAREGAKVTGLDLTPVLLDAARRNAAMAGVEVDWREGDAEALPFADASFDTVVSQFGHMFAPRPGEAVREMLRVLRPGGRIAFSTWPPESLPGRMFAFVAKALPPPPGIPPVGLWGEAATIQERLGNAVRDIRFERGTFGANALGPRHFLALQETGIGPLAASLEAVARAGPEAARRFRGDYLAMVEPFFDGNVVQHDYLMTRATKA